jgi:xanthine dehydrogenase accessory factor
MGRSSEFSPAAAGGESLFAWLAAQSRAGVPFVLATVTDTGGSTPRLAGAMMGVSAGGQSGTIGGGAFEHHVIAEARALLAAPGRSTAVVDVHLVRDLGMCCGGKMTAFLNKTEPAPCLWIFGAGHVGTELAPLAQRAGFQVTVVDSRAEWADAVRFPEGVEVLDAEPDDLLKRRRPGPHAYVVVTTHSHALDEQLVAALSAEPPAYTGLIGSRAKWARFRARLTERGVPVAFLDAVRSPVGLDIGAITPAEIAVSIVAELVSVRRAARPGEG